MQLEPDIKGYICFLILGWQREDMESRTTTELVDPPNALLHIQYTMESIYRRSAERSLFGQPPESVGSSYTGLCEQSLDSPDTHSFPAEHDKQCQTAADLSSIGSSHA